MATITLQLRKMPEEINRILKKKQGELLINKGVLHGKEQILYMIVKEWEQKGKKES